MILFHEKQHVRLKPFHNGNEQVPEEFGTLCDDVEIEEGQPLDEISVCLYVDKKYFQIAPTMVCVN